MFFQSNSGLQSKLMSRSRGGKGKSVPDVDEIEAIELLERTSSSSAGHMGKQEATDGL